MREILFKAKRADGKVWVDLKGYVGIYQITSNGRVRSVDRYVKHWKGGKCLKRGVELKPAVSRKGYLLVHISKEGKGKLKSLHRLVAETFIPNPENKKQVNHIDGDKSNNSVSNLEWVTQSENMDHAFKTGLNKGSMFGVKGEEHPRTLLSNSDEKTIQDLVKKRGFN